jgi:mannosyltransferase
MNKESILNFFKDEYLIILIFLLAVIVRFYNLGGESIWYDEAVSVAVSKLGFIDQIKWIISNTNEANPPFYYMVLHTWIPVFGDSEYVSRIPSAFFGSLSVLAMYLFGKLIFNKRAGIIAALILALAVFHVRYAQEARGYTLMVCLILVSYYFLIKLMDGRKTSYAVGYVVSSVLLVYTHFYGVMFILAENIFCFSLFLKNKRIGMLGLGKWFKLQVITGLFMLPSLILLVARALNIQEGWWIPEPDTEQIYEYLTIYAGSIYLLILFAAFSVYSVINIGKTRGPGNTKKPLKSPKDSPDGIGISEGGKLYMLFLILVVPILIPFLISRVSSPILIFRYTIGASLAFYLLASKGISEISNIWIVRALAALIVVFSFVSLNYYYKMPTKHQWREVMSDIEARSGYGDVIVVFPPREEVPAKYYSHRKDLKIIPLRGKFPALENLGDKNVWFVIHASPLNRERTREGLSGQYDFISEKHFVRLDLFQLRKKKK